jgi:hypothetical protein
MASKASWQLFIFHVGESDQVNLFQTCGEGWDTLC